MIRNRQREDAEVDEAKRKLVPRLVVAVLALVVGLTGAVSASPGSGASGVVLAQGRMPGRLKIKTREASDVVVQQVTLQPGGFTGWHTHPGVVLARRKLLPERHLIGMHRLLGRERQCDLRHVRIPRRQK